MENPGAPNSFAEAAAQFLASVGISSATERDDVERAVAEFLSECGYNDDEVSFGGYRYGQVWLEARPDMVRFVTLDTDRLADVLKEAGVKARVRVRSRRR